MGIKIARADPVTFQLRAVLGACPVAKKVRCGRVAAAATTLVHAIGRLAGYRCTDVLVIAQIPNGTHQDGVPLLRAAPSRCPLD
jgi:hypothetical protein